MSGKGKKDGEATVENCECLAESVNEGTSRIKNVTHPLRYYEFTQEEIKALEECDRESFFRRCIPLSTLFATLTYAAIKTGYLKKHEHFGVVPKVAIAAMLGYAYGRFSYMSACDERLRQLPTSSHLGNLMRQYHAAASPRAVPKSPT